MVTCKKHQLHHFHKQKSHGNKIMIFYSLFCKINNWELNYVHNREDIYNEHTGRTCTRGKSYSLAFGKCNPRIIIQIYGKASDAKGVSKKLVHKKSPPPHHANVTWQLRVQIKHNASK